MHLYSHKSQLQKQEIKKNKGKRITHNMSKNTTCQMHTNYAQWEHKITNVQNRWHGNAKVAHIIN